MKNRTCIVGCTVYFFFNCLISKRHGHRQNFQTMDIVFSSASSICGEGLTGTPILFLFLFFHKKEFSCQGGWVQNSFQHYINNTSLTVSEFTNIPFFLFLKMGISCYSNGYLQKLGNRVVFYYYYYFYRTIKLKFWFSAKWLGRWGWCPESRRQVDWMWMGSLNSMKG